MKVYALVDFKGQDIVSIFQSVSDEAAERSFLKLLTDGMPIVSDFPEDFAVFPVGVLTFDMTGLQVCAMGNENLEAHGFDVERYCVREPIKRGCDYDRRYLRMVAQDRGTDLSKLTKPVSSSGADHQSEEDNMHKDCEVKTDG